MAWEYSEKTKELFMAAVHGEPGTHMGEVSDPDGIGEHGSIACGDALRFTFRCDRHPTDATRDVIVEARYLTFGCTSAIAASEALCTIIEDRRCTPIEALSITNKDIVSYLGGLPAQKLHCSVMGAEALEAAVYNWSQKRGVSLEDHGIRLRTHDQQEGRIVCQCFSVTEPRIRQAIEEHQLRTIEDITGAIKAGGGCSTCHHSPGGLQDLLDEAWGSKGQETLVQLTRREREREPRPEPPAPDEAISPYQFAKKIEQVIEGHLRPMLRCDGGDLELIDIKEQLVYVRLRGACAQCLSADVTLKHVVEQTLRNQVDQRIRVVSV
jgi:NifU-like protein